MSKLIQIILVIAVITVADAIQCNFVYKESDVVIPTSDIVWPNDPNRFKPPPKKYEETKNEPFECDDPALDEFSEISVGNVSVNNRNTSEDDGFVLVEEMCHSSRKTIQPKELNNINNQKRKIAVVQSITIEECVNPKSSCTSEAVPDNKRVICVQKHLIIRLTVDDRNKKIEEPFYYPSACICATYMKKSDL
ncbi:uncharacterized protein [Chironomus tepperi]|uniref:uncharacterized protein n=1 Tax=Chironomus tepperi TaxID=113505 RepID=UPI00391F8A77